MENKAGSTESQRIYEDFEPFCKWHGHDMVEVHLQGFRKEHLRVQTNDMRILTIHGERPLSETTWSRFHKEIKLADKCDPNGVRAKLAGGVLTVTMPHKEIPNVIPSLPANRKTTSTTADHQDKNIIEKQKLPASTTTNDGQIHDSNAKLLDHDYVKPTSCEFRGGQSGRRTALVSRFIMGKDVAVKLVVAVAVVVAFGWGAYVVKQLKQGHP